MAEIWDLQKFTDGWQMGWNFHWKLIAEKWPDMSADLIRNRRKFNWDSSTPILTLTYMYDKLNSQL